MDLTNVSNVYSILRDYLVKDKIVDAAYDVVEHLLKQGYESEEIEEAFDGMEEIYDSLNSLTGYDQPAEDEFSDFDEVELDGLEMFDEQDEDL